MSQAGDRCACAKPKPSESMEEHYEILMGTVVWAGGVEYMACMNCGYRITDPVRLTSEPVFVKTTKKKRTGDDDAIR